jgi:hypothetical protein
MTAIPNARYERKFVPAVLSADAVLGAVRRNPALFREAFPPRTVNNVYLDTPGLTDYRQHVSGHSERIKTRVRWYGDLEGQVAPVLERKIRRGLLGGKEICPLPVTGLDAAGGLRGIELSLRRADLPALAREAVACRTPALVNRYDRRYLVSADGRFRLTIDTHLRYLGARPVASTSLLTTLESPGVIIVELKYAPEDAEDAVAVANGLPFLISRFSKYVTGIDRLYGRG